MLFLNQFCANFLVGYVQLYSNHKAKSTNFCHMWKFLVFQSIHQIGANFSGVLYQMLFFNNV